MRLQFNPSTGKLSYNTTDNAIQSVYPSCVACGREFTDSINITFNGLSDAGCVTIPPDFSSFDALNSYDVADSLNGNTYQIPHTETVNDTCTYVGIFNGDFGTVEVYKRGAPFLSTCEPGDLVKTKNLDKLRIGIQNFYNSTGYWGGYIIFAGLYSGDCLVTVIVDTVVDQLFNIRTRMPFKDGSVQPPNQSTISGQRSGTSAKVSSVAVTSGSFANGDAAGFLTIFQYIGSIFKDEDVNVLGGYSCHVAGDIEANKIPCRDGSLPVRTNDYDIDAPTYECPSFSSVVGGTLTIDYGV